MHPALRTIVSPSYLAAFGALALFLVALVIVGPSAAPGLARAAIAFASFYVLVGVGQMLVITSGPGNIDLSIPFVMTLAGYLAMGQMLGSDAGIAEGILLGLAVGLAAGAWNVFLIAVARIPPMIATLASGFILQSIAIAYSRGSTAKPAPALQDLTFAAFLGVPLLGWFAALVVVAAALTIRYGAFGRAVEAIGQGDRAARFAGVRVLRTRMLTFLASSVLAAVAGMLFAAYSGGASLNMADDFLLISIAVVVIGGTSIAGGQAAPVGLFGGALFLYLVVAVLNMAQFSAGLRSVLTGLIIIGVLALSGRRTTR